MHWSEAIQGSSTGSHCCCNCRGAPPHDTSHSSGTSCILDPGVHNITMSLYLHPELARVLCDYCDRDRPLHDYLVVQILRLQYYHQGRYSTTTVHCALELLQLLSTYTVLLLVLSCFVLSLLLGTHVIRFIQRIAGNKKHKEDHCSPAFARGWKTWSMKPCDGSEAWQALQGNHEGLVSVCLL